MIENYELDSLVKKVWKNVLKNRCREIGAADNFFSLGGTQPEAIRAVALLEDALDCSLPADLILTHPRFDRTCDTVRSLFARPTGDWGLPQDIQFQDQVDFDYLRDIAVIGMETRFPGGKNKQEYWENLKSSRILDFKAFKRRIKLVKDFHWNGWIYCIDDIEKFDNNFFKIPDEDAKFIDPQQRVLLETVYHALEDAGLAWMIGEGADVGVYAGTSYLNYIEIIRPYFEEPVVRSPEIALSLCLNSIPSRISYVFNFKGPSFCIDTACSSSLTALNYAVSDLRSKKAAYAVVAGLNLIITPIFNSLLKGIGIVGTDKRCRVFDTQTTGTVLGEGAGVVVLQRLDTAVKERRRIYGIIKGVGINNTGLSMGIMTPHPDGQYGSLLKAYQDAGVNPGAVTYIEAHGTGTKMGDAIEIHAIKKFFCKFTRQNEDCAIGSVKSNIGHLLSAAGMAGLIKVLLCLYHKELVPSLHIAAPGKKAGLNPAPFYFCQQHKKWNTDGVPRVAGVNSFGIGGTNVHAVLSEAPSYRPGDAAPGRWQILSISAQSASSLKQNIRSLSRFLAGNRTVPVENLCYSYNCLKPHFTYRKAFVGRNLKDFGEALDGYQSSSGIRTSSRIAFLFSDITKFRTGFGDELYVHHPYFREIIDNCLVRINAVLHRNSCSTLQIKPCCQIEDLKKIPFLHRFTAYYALTRYLQYLGISPEAVIGIGSGNIMAAVIAGCVDLDEALHAIILYWGTETPGLHGKAARIMVKPAITYISNLKELEAMEISGLLEVFDPRRGDAIGTQAGIGEQLKKNRITVIIPLYEDRAAAALIKPLPVEIYPAAAGKAEEKRLIRTIAMLYESGRTVRWKRIYGTNNRIIDGLPHYNFDRKTHWIEFTDAH